MLPPFGRNLQRIHPNYFSITGIFATGLVFLRQVKLFEANLH